MAKIQDLAQYLSQKHKISKKEAERFLTAVVDVLNEALRYEKQAKVKGLGTFKVIEVKDRESVNVNTGERIVIEGRQKITFTADSVMKDLVNKPFAQFDTVVLNDGVTFDDIPEEEAMAEDDDAEQTVAETVAEETAQEPAETEPQPELEQLMDDAATEEPVEEEQEEPTPVQEEIPVVVQEVAPIAAEDVLTTLVEEPEVSNAEAEPEQNEPEPQPVAEETEPAEEQPVEEIGEEIAAISPVMEKEMQPEVEKMPEPEADEMPDTDPEETEEPDEPKRSMAWLWWLLGMLVFGALMFYVGYLMGSKPKETPVAVEKPVTVVTDTIEKVDSAEIKAALEAEKAAKAKAAEEAEAAKKAAYEAEVKKQQAEEVAEEDNNPKALNNARNIVRTGAYNIVGTQQTVVVRKGQTLEKVSKAYLGPGMEVYVMVHNGVTEAKEGSTLKIPKLEVKKKR